MTVAITIEDMPYQHFHQASKQLHGLNAIDFFMAKEVCQLLNSDSELLFHIVIATHQFLADGHSCAPINKLSDTYIGQSFDEEGVQTHAGYLFPSVDEIEHELSNFPDLYSGESLVVIDNGHVYLRRYYLLERELAAALEQKNQIVEDTETSQLANIMSVVFPQQSQDEIDYQALAVANALNKNLVVIAGGPGTGKTYTVTKLLAALVMQRQQSQTVEPLSIALSAPTGKAAQRLSESIIAAVNGFKEQIPEEVLSHIPTQAQTIHRLLGVKPNQVNFKHNQDNQLPVDVLLVDEASMIDLALMTRIFRALPAQAKIILLGDADQLPSVAAGSVLADIAPRPHAGYSQENLAFLQGLLSVDLSSLSSHGEHHCDHLTILTHSRRFDGQGGIGVVAKAVIDGDAAHSWQRLQQDPSQQVSLLTQGGENWLKPLVKEHYSGLLIEKDLASAFEQLAKFRILVATRKGQLGVETLNQKVVDILIEDKLLDPSQKFKKQPMYHGMPIMITENHHRLGLYNGDVGLIWHHEGQLMAVFEQAQGYKMVIPSRLPKFELVYAMTIHKTQGSEFSHVFLALPPSTKNKLLTRELLYTGITRAKTQLTVMGEFDVWQQGVIAKVTRYSQLAL